MAESALSFTARLALAWKILLDGAFAARTQAADQPASASPAPAPAMPPPQLHSAPPDAALQLLGLLQQEGRFIDFLQEDVSQYSDADIGAAARVVHQGCRKVLDQHVGIEPVSNLDEGSRLTLQAGFDAAAYRLTGNVVGQAPFQGTLSHRGWRATHCQLPKVADGHDVTVLAPAEVEL
ncbi:MAG: DUF2760 domain-containing protein [Gammaproteobacteria bacterium]